MFACKLCISQPHPAKMECIQIVSKLRFLTFPLRQQQGRVEKLAALLEARLVQFSLVGCEEFELQATSEATQLSKASCGKPMLHVIG